MPNGKTILIDVQLDKTKVNDVKQKVMEKSGLRLEDIILVYKEEILRNDYLLKQYGIDKEAKIDAETAETLTKNFKQKLDALENEIQRWQQKFGEEGAQKEELQERLKESSNKLDEVKQEKEMLQRDFNQVKNQLEQLQKKNAQNADSQQSQISTQSFLGNDLKNLEIELASYKAIVSRFDMERTELNSQIAYFKQEKIDLQKKVEDYQKLKEDLIGKTFEIKGLQKDLDFANSRGSQTKDEINRELDFSRQQIRKLEQQLEEVKTKNQELEVEKVKQELKIHIDSQQVEKLNELQSQNSQLEKRIAEYKAQVTSLNDQVRLLQNRSQEEMRSSIRGTDFASAEKIQGYELQINRLNAELKSSQQSFNESQQCLSAAKKQCFDSDKKIMELEKSVESLTYLLKEKDRGIKEREQSIKQLNIELEETKKDLIIYQKNLSDFKQIAQQADPKKVLEIDSEALKVEEKLKAREEQRNKEQKRLEQQRQEELLGRQEKLKQEQQQYFDLMQKGKEQRQKTAQFLKKQMLESHGKIEVCFLIDVTGSMDPYKEQAMKCIKESMKNIKIKTNRDALWATVAYQDFGELKQLGGLYKQLNFTPNPKEIEEYLADIPCAGGGDAAEDIRGGIMQMIKNLHWSKTFKIALLICDAPTHGKRYNGGVSDRYPNEDIEDAINLLIDHNILFVAILFNKVTLPMFEEIKKMYQRADKEELLLFADLENTEQGRIWQELVDLVSQASQRATQTNNKGTRSKNNQANKRSQSGAMEALCKQIKDPFQFDKLSGVTIIPVKFGVYRVELKQDSFEQNIENLKRLDINRDYSVYQEGQWDCIRTEKYFAQGQMKQVFLMKRQNNQNELYVIKMPIGDLTYSSQEQAVVECRSHLISKCLMKKFIRELQEARDKIDRSMKIPEVQYSDFLILKDLERGNSFWIAERYFTGEFVKYNNNYGFISDENSDINHLAQAYTYYTYFISNFNYMVNDVQGVGNYFTDPALNTKDSNFDETDMGIDGQSMYMVSYEGKKHMGRKYLDLLSIPQP
ncbi:unnamed protein product [Paramecium pentaurelia]|uniref:Alpha-type protein kinase domain-containing protein n=1 Tax=Paramecium pentaurelia TaxID=43138 RepID=A0A8S1USX9_9CILI|nr:unnamed protein product [Paramecium pentaurelia]